MAIVGYKRVSTVEQNTNRQLDGEPLDKVFVDKASGKNSHRPQLQAALDYVRDGDTLVVHSMDRLARNLDDLRSIVKQLTTDGVRVRFVKEALTFTGEDSPMNTMLLSMLGAVAEFERSMILERQREGIKIAQQQGKYKGGKPKLSDQQVTELRARKTGGETVTALAKDYGVTRATVYNYLSNR